MGFPGIRCWTDHPDPCLACLTCRITTGHAPPPQFSSLKQGQNAIYGLSGACDTLDGSSCAFLSGLARQALPLPPPPPRPPICRNHAACHVRRPGVSLCSRLGRPKLPTARAKELRSEPLHGLRERVPECASVRVQCPAIFGDRDPSAVAMAMPRRQHRACALRTFPRGQGFRSLLVSALQRAKVHRASHPSSSPRPPGPAGKGLAVCRDRRSMRSPCGRSGCSPGSGQAGLSTFRVAAAPHPNPIPNPDAQAACLPWAMPTLLLPWCFALCRTGFLCWPQWLPPPLAGTPSLFFDCQAPWVSCGVAGRDLVTHSVRRGGGQRDAPS